MQNSLHMKQKVYCYFQVNGTTILKSGSDFRQFSKVVIDFREDPIDVEIDAIDVSKEFEPDVELSKCLDEFSGMLHIDFAFD